jgi:ADP-ribose pyrophosphatase YjhB (NUDIX family)
MERREILERIRVELGPDGVGRFCFVCGAAGVSTIATPQGEMFECDAAGHRSPQAFIFDGKAVFSFEDGELIHEATGAIIRREAGASRQTLLFLRQKYPFQYTIPAGHVEVGRAPEAEMRREVHEETGLIVRGATRLWPGETLLLKDPCRRGADFHRWHVFEVVTEGFPRLSDEGRVLGWYTDDELRDLAARDLLTAPVSAILIRLGLLDFTLREGT